MKLDIFGRGFTLQLAITVACEMAFILFGEIQVPYYPNTQLNSVADKDSVEQVTTKVFSVELSGMIISSTSWVTQVTV